VRGDGFLAWIVTWFYELLLLIPWIRDAAAICESAAQTGNVTAWVSGTTYAVGDNRFDPVTLLTYRRKTAGAGTTRPGLDGTNWQLLTGFGDVDLSSTQTLTNKTHGAGSVWDGQTIPVDHGGTGLTDGSNLLPPGTVGQFARNTAPTGWLKANGAAVSRTTYAELFAAIGTTFGVGNGSTTFTLPDLRGEFIRGWDDARGVDVGRVFGSAQAAANQAHTHTGSTSTDPGHVHGLPVFASGGGSTGSTNIATSVVDATNATRNTNTAGSHSHTVTINSDGTEGRPRNMALLVCIKF
jgi:microcystin-dependent protein